VDILNQNKLIDYNLWGLHDYFQTEEVTNILYKHLRSDEYKNNIIQKNPYKGRYNNNNDLFIHIRLGDFVQYGLYLPIEYYLGGIKKLSGNFEKIYLGSDSLDHEIIKELQILYPKIILVDTDPIKTIQLGSTCKHIILSGGSFSGVIGYLSFFSNIYYSEYQMMGEPGIFTNKSWNIIKKSEWKE